MCMWVEALKIDSEQRQTEVGRGTRDRQRWGRQASVFSVPCSRIQHRQMCTHTHNTLRSAFTAFLSVSLHKGRKMENLSKQASDEHAAIGKTGTHREGGGVYLVIDEREKKNSIAKSWELLKANRQRKKDGWESYYRDCKERERERWRNKIAENEVVASKTSYIVE